MTTLAERELILSRWRNWRLDWVTNLLSEEVVEVWDALSESLAHEKVLTKTGQRILEMAERHLKTSWNEGEWIECSKAFGKFRDALAPNATSETPED